MEDTPLSELPVGVHMMSTSTRIMSTFGTSSATSATISYYCRTNDLIFGLESEIDEDISTEDALDINGDVGESDVEGDEFELQMNANETEYSIEEDSITGEGNVEKGYRKNFMKVIACGYMELRGEIDVDNSMRFEVVEILSTPDDYVPSEVNTIKI